MPNYIVECHICGCVFDAVSNGEIECPDCKNKDHDMFKYKRIDKKEESGEQQEGQ